MMLVTDLAVLDHTDGTVLLIANALRGDGGGYDDAVGPARRDGGRPAEAVPPGVAVLEPADRRR